MDAGAGRRYEVRYARPGRLHREQPRTFGLDGAGPSELQLGLKHAHTSPPLGLTRAAVRRHARR